MVGDIWVDDTGNEIKSAFDLGGLRLELVAADKQLALAHKSPPELLNNMLIELDRPIDNPRALHKATYRLSVKQGELPDLPGSPIQNARRIDRQTARVTVDLAHADPGPVPKMAAPPVRHSAMADGRDAKIIDLAEQATENAGDKRAARAEAMRRFVHDHVDDKNLGVGMATAGEVARTQQGDCTEHAVLLAALLRADGIPSRMASGVVYVHDGSGRRDVFGYHAWTQAWIDDNAGPRWVNLDAALTAAHPYDATHIILSTTDLEDGQWTNDIVEMAGLFGRLRIERVNAQP
jgi:transglutaminase-like putative cysteine protease